MAVKTANVTARIQPEIKEHAEAILEKLGIPVSVFIDMAYRQVIMRDGVPFSLEIPSTLTTRDALSKEEFDTIMQALVLRRQRQMTLWLWMMHLTS